MVLRLGWCLGRRSQDVPIPVFFLTPDVRQKPPVASAFECLVKRVPWWIFVVLLVVVASHLQDVRSLPQPAAVESLFVEVFAEHVIVVQVELFLGYRGEEWAPLDKLTPVVEVDRGVNVGKLYLSRAPLALEVEELPLLYLPHAVGSPFADGKLLPFCICEALPGVLEYADFFIGVGFYEHVVE